MNKKLRQQVYDKYNGRCAYCGCDLQKGWHVDHIQPAWRTWDSEDIKLRLKIEKGKDELNNYNPSCPRCNKWKSTWSIDQFRGEISMQIERLKRDSSAFRMALDYKLIEETKKEVKFYFETLEI